MKHFCKNFLLTGLIIGLSFIAGSVMAVTISTTQTISADINDDLTINSGGVVTITSGPINIDGTITINGTGRLIISTDVTFTGNLIINGSASPLASLDVENGNTLGDSNGGNIEIFNSAAIVTIAGTLTNDGSFINDGNVTVTGSLDIPNGDLENNGTGNITVTSPGTIDVPNGDITNDGTINGSGTVTTTGTITNNGTFFDCDGGLSCCSGGSCSSTTPLPVELLSFDATYKNGQVCLEWATATEVNNDYFTIERSRDAISYNLVDQVTGHGNSQEVIYYSLIDENPYSGVSYYRLTQTDFDGQYEVFPLQFVESQSTPFRLYPSELQVGQSFTLDLSAFDASRFPVAVEVRDMTGKTVLVQSLNDGPGFHRITPQRINHGGMYLVLVDGIFRQRIKVN